MNTSFFDGQIFFKSGLLPGFLRQKWAKTSENALQNAPKTSQPTTNHSPSFFQKSPKIPQKVAKNTKKPKNKWASPFLKWARKWHFSSQNRYKTYSNNIQNHAKIYVNSNKLAIISHMTPTNYLHEISVFSSSVFSSNENNKP